MKQYLTIKQPKINYTLEEIKPLVLKHLKEEHTNTSFNDCFCCKYCLSTKISYELYYHQSLIKYLKSINKKKHPTNADKLCFLVLLSYPIDFIEKLNDLSEIKLFSDENTDFNFIEMLEDTTELNDCCCGHKKLYYVHVVENKYSKVRLQVGSECITNYKLVSGDELEKIKNAEKLYKEKQKEIQEGKPIGYYEEERKRKKELAKEEKVKKHKEKLNKKIASNENYKLCYICQDNIADKRTYNICVCTNCIHLNYTILTNDIKINKYNFYECAECNKMFINKKTNMPYVLCKKCQLISKLIKCSSYSCEAIILTEINDYAINYCDDCEKNIIQCIDCDKNFIKNGSQTRCKSCQYNLNNNIIMKSCVKCMQKMLVKSTETWKVYCNICYVEVNERIDNPPICKCGDDMIEKIIKKNGINKGRKGLACPNYPNGCNDFIIL
jgi:hypothetical protein